MTTSSVYIVVSGRQWGHDVHAKQNRALEGALRHSHVPSLLSQSPHPSKVLLGTTPTFAIFPFSLLCCSQCQPSSLGISLQWSRVCVCVCARKRGTCWCIYTVGGPVSSIVAFSCKNNKHLTQISADSCEYWSFDMTIDPKTDIFAI